MANDPNRKLPGPIDGPGISNLAGHPDPESEAFVQLLAREEAIKGARVSGVRTVLVILSAAGMVFDVEALRQKVLLTYPEAAVFFLTTLGKPIGPAAPRSVDLLIDFTGPGQRQGLFAARRFGRMARVSVGRNAGFFRRRGYDRVFDETTPEQVARLSRAKLDRERQVQREVLALAGIPLAQHGDTPADRGKLTPLELPPMAKL